MRELAGVGQDFGTLLIDAARRSAPRYVARAAQHMHYQPMGVFFSEALALVAAAELTGATHLIESGTAQGQSTELLARYFRGRLNITTIDADATYGLFEKTKKRLSRHPSITCIRGDSFVEIPRLLRGLPADSRAIVFVDGPKGRLGKQLALRSLRHPRVALVALHDAAEVWDPKLHKELLAHRESLLETSRPPYRQLFAGLDHSHNESEIVTHLYEQHPTWSRSKIPLLLSHGHGLWLAGRSKLLGPAGPFIPRTYVAMGCDLGDRHPQIPGLLATIASLLANALRPSSFTVFVFAGSSAVDKVRQAVGCLRSAGALRGAEVKVIKLDSHTVSKYPLLRTAIDESTLVNYARFYLPALLPEVKKVLWVDIDGLVLGDVRTLLSQLFLAPSKALLAVVEKRRRPLTQEINNVSSLNAVDPELYNLVVRREHVFNAGFIALNLEGWRAHGVTALLEGMVQRLNITGSQRCGLDKWGGMSTSCDSQTPLILVMRGIPGSLEKLRGLWNVDGLGWKTPRLSPQPVPRNLLCEARFLHWSGSGKPWAKRKAPRNSYAAMWRAVSDAVRFHYDPHYDPRQLCNGRLTTKAGSVFDWTGKYTPLSAEAASADLYAALWRAHAEVHAGSCLSGWLDRPAALDERALNTSR